MPRHKARVAPVMRPECQPVIPSDSVRMVILKLREEATWYPEDGKAWRLFLRAAEELEKRIGNEE